jgi:hypothetical protein
VRKYGIEEQRKRRHLDPFIRTGRSPYRDATTVCGDSSPFFFWTFGSIFAKPQAVKELYHGLRTSLRGETMAIKHLMKYQC